MVGLTSHEPSLQSVRDDRGELQPGFYKAKAERNVGGSRLAKRGEAVLEEINSSYGGLLGDTGEGLLPELFGHPKNEQSQWLRMATDLAAPGSAGAEANPAQTRYFLNRQRQRFVVRNKGTGRAGHKPESGSRRYCGLPSSGSKPSTHQFSGSAWPMTQKGAPFTRCSERSSARIASATSSLIRFAHDFAVAFSHSSSLHANSSDPQTAP
jgi:hypothetical protein